MCLLIRWRPKVFEEARKKDGQRAAKVKRRSLTQSEGQGETETLHCEFRYKAWARQKAEVTEVRESLYLLSEWSWTTSLNISIQLLFRSNQQAACLQASNLQKSSRWQHKMGSCCLNLISGESATVVAARRVSMGLFVYYTAGSSKEQWQMAFMYEALWKPSRK